MKSEEGHIWRSAIAPDRERKEARTGAGAQMDREEGKDDTIRKTGRVDQDLSRV